MSAELINLLNTNKKNTMNTITYKGKEYQEVTEELFESCKGCAFEIEGCDTSLPCGENNSIYKEIDDQEFSLTKSEYV